MVDMVDWRACLLSISIRALHIFYRDAGDIGGIKSHWASGLRYSQEDMLTPKHRLLQPQYSNFAKFSNTPTDWSSSSEYVTYSNWLSRADRHG